MSVTTVSTKNQAVCEGIRETREFLRKRNSSVAEYVESVLAAIHQADQGLHAFVAVAEQDAIRDARRADDLIARLGDEAWRNRPLLGVTISVKDLIQTADLPTARGSLLPNDRPRQDAPAVARLRTLGAIVVGKTTTSEYGWSASTVSRASAATRNPWASGLSAGGSSGGAAASVAAGLCTAALGTDGAGSIRIPSAFCGVVGYKPSFGRVPYVPPCADRLAHLGPIARSVSDAAEIAAAIAGPHHADPDSVSAAVASTAQPRRLRIGCIEFPGTSAAVRAVTEEMWPLLAAQGHRVERIGVPFTDPYSALVDILAAGEAAGTDPGDDDRCDQGRLAIAAYGRTLDAAAVMRAEQARLALRTRLRSVMDRYDLLAMATVPTEPFGVDAIAPSWAADPADLLWLAWSPASYPFNMTGQPALSMPVGRTGTGLPVGLQLVGPVGGDCLVLSAASRIEADLAQRLAPSQ